MSFSDVVKSPAKCCEESDVTAIFVADDNDLIDVSLMPNGFTEKK